MKFILSFYLLLCTYLVCNGQYVPEPGQKKDTTIYVSSSKKEESYSPGKTGFDTEKLVPGGNFALSFGNPYFIDISPSLGYMVTENLLLGLGATYIASGGNIGFGNYTINIYGGRIIGRRKLFENFFANAELDFLNSPNLSSTNNENTRKWFVSPMVGGSYVMPFGKRGGVQATLLYILNYNDNVFSPYPSALVWRLGFFL